MDCKLKRTDPVTVLNLEPRTQRLLEREGIKTIEDLMLLIRTDKLLAIRNIGARGYKAIIDQVGCNTPLWDGWHRAADCMPDDGVPVFEWEDLEEAIQHAPTIIDIDTTSQTVTKRVRDCTVDEIVDYCHTRRCRVCDHANPYAPISYPCLIFKSDNPALWDLDRLITVRTNPPEHY